MSKRWSPMKFQHFWGRSQGQPTAGAQKASPWQAKAGMFRANPGVFGP
jgi:hypothetical protein